MNILRKFADNRQVKSLATELRMKRFFMFKTLISLLPKPLRILDLGGTQAFWESMGFTDEDNVKISILNLSKIEVTYPNFDSLVGDARKMSDFKDKEFDIVFSNSVIEHVGDYSQQRQMAEEIKRIGKRYFIQTPNRYFLIEPHFLFPFFQFLPLSLQVFLVSHFNVGWYKKIPDIQEARLAVTSIRLLTEKELEGLFPGATIFKEKFLGMIKSFIIYAGWDSFN